MSELPLTVLEEKRRALAGALDVLRPAAEELEKLRPGWYVVVNTDNATADDEIAGHVVNAAISVEQAIEYIDRARGKGR